MNVLSWLLTLFFLAVPFVSSGHAGENGFSLTVHVKGLNSDKGNVLVGLYNKEGSFPDPDYTKCLRKQVAEIENGTATVVFTDVLPGRYAVNALHDENSNGKIDKGFLLPKEGIGFTNYTSISPLNRPDFEGAGFVLESDTEKTIRIIYL